MPSRFALTIAIVHISESFANSLNINEPSERSMYLDTYERLEDVFGHDQRGIHLLRVPKTWCMVLFAISHRVDRFLVNGV
ncbi:hypothetical protein EDB19DRAFT_1714747 [Suillus lakei]|nr:hypothetical protein EDB19DRAFT_1714747 [Suillus lakei]